MFAPSMMVASPYLLLDRARAAMLQIPGVLASAALPAIAARPLASAGGICLREAPGGVIIECGIVAEATDDLREIAAAVQIAVSRAASSMGETPSAVNIFIAAVGERPAEKASAHV